MRRIFNDFMTSQRRPDGTIRIPLGSECTSAQLAGLADGERILIVDPESLEAVAVAESTVSDGERFWYGIVPNAAAIRNIDPDSLTDEANRAASHH